MINHIPEHFYAFSEPSRRGQGLLEEQNLAAASIQWEAPTHLTCFLLENLNLMTIHNELLTCLKLCKFHQTENDMLDTDIGIP